MALNFVNGVGHRCTRDFTPGSNARATSFKRCSFNVHRLFAEANMSKNKLKLSSVCLSWLHYVSSCMGPPTWELPLHKLNTYFKTKDMGLGRRISPGVLDRGKCFLSTVWCGGVQVPTHAAHVAARRQNAGSSREENFMRPHRYASWFVYLRFSVLYPISEQFDCSYVLWRMNVGHPNASRNTINHAMHCRSFFAWCRKYY